jgi:predicted dehydrogenase
MEGANLVAETAVQESVGNQIGIGVIGFGWMAGVHAQAYARLRHHFPDLPVAPRLVAMADPLPARPGRLGADQGAGGGPAGAEGQRAARTISNE